MQDIWYTTSRKVAAHMLRSTDLEDAELLRMTAAHTHSPSQTVSQWEKREEAAARKSLHRARTLGWQPSPGPQDYPYLLQDGSLKIQGVLPVLLANCLYIKVLTALSLGLVNLLKQFPEL